jgi:curved DNA-binding protein CbpA
MKTDAYALLGLPRGAVLTEDEVRAAFQKAAAAVHPDNAADENERAARTADFTALNEAAATLSSLPRRLRHLLELEHPDMAAQKSGAPMDSAMLNLFSMTAAAVQRAAAVQSKQQQAATALVRAMLANEEMQAQESLEAALRSVESARAELEAGLDSLTNAPSLAAAAARAGFLEKWQAQLRAAFAGFFAAAP